MIHCFGDSWTYGIGVEVPPGSEILSQSDKYNNDWSKERLQYSWSGQLNELLNKKYKVKNYAVAGISNFDIYQIIISNLKNKKIKKGDLVIIAFSSIIREPLNFLTVNNDTGYGFTDYSNSCMVGNSIKNNDYFIYPHWITQLNDGMFKESVKNMYMDFIVNRFDENILYEISMNYVCNLQSLFEFYGVPCIFLNSFENVISEKIHFYKLIKKENWILFNYTLSEYLIDKSKDFDDSLPYSLWEDNIKNPPKCADGPHPNRIGHKLIAELIYSEIIKRNIIKDIYEKDII